MQMAVAKQGCEPKMAIDAVHEMIDSMTKLMQFSRSKLVARRESFHI
jgi:cystathionine beta-lyase family protein involved in aluminum resistance